MCPLARRTIHDIARLQFTRKRALVFVAQHIQEGMEPLWVRGGFLPTNHYVAPAPSTTIANHLMKRADLTRARSTSRPIPSVEFGKWPQRSKLGQQIPP
jgi:hypothetical protein